MKRKNVIDVEDSPTKIVACEGRTIIQGEGDMRLWFKDNYHKLGYDEILKSSTNSTPDYVMGRKKKKVRVELEVFASNFVHHGHTPKEVDEVVCVYHDRAVPVEVITVNEYLMLEGELLFLDPLSYQTYITAFTPKGIEMNAEMELTNWAKAKRWATKRAATKDVDDKDDVEVRILFALLEKPLRMSHIAKKAKLDRQIVRYHISSLVGKGLILPIEDKRVRYWSLQPIFMTTELMDELMENGVKIVKYIGDNIIVPDGMGGTDMGRIVTNNARLFLQVMDICL